MTVYISYFSLSVGLLLPSSVLSLYCITYQNRSNGIYSVPAYDSKMETHSSPKNLSRLTSFELHYVFDECNQSSIRAFDGNENGYMRIENKVNARDLQPT